MMSISFKYRFYRKVALLMAMIIIGQAVFPTVSMALTSGPGAPEFSSFEPVSTTSMVNDFGGDFSYNLPIISIPGANGGDYAMSLSYHSGEGMESEASWVGSGWTLNPGAINRNKRGFPDDSKGDKVTYYNQVPKNWTVAVGGSLGGLELFSADIPVNVSATLRYNNYRGFGYTAGAGISVGNGVASLGYSISDGEGSFSVSVNPAALLGAVDKEQKKTEKSESYKAANEGDKKKMMAVAKQKDKKTTNRNKSVMGKVGSATSAYGMHSFSDDIRATKVTAYEGRSFSFSVSLAADPAFIDLAASFGLNGSYSYQQNINNGLSNPNTYGYLYSGDATDPNSMMDYYVEKESMYNKRDKYMSIPFSNADVYSISGEGLGGGFRIHSRTSGHFRPNAAHSKMDIIQTSGDVQLGTALGLGFDLGVGQQTLDVGRSWNTNGNTSHYNFKQTTDGDEQYFMRFNNDLGGNVTHSTDDRAVAAHVNPLSGGVQYEPNISENSLLTDINDQIDNLIDRSGRSSYISYHTNNEMTQTSSTGKNYYAYDKNASTSAYINRASVKDGIGEITTFNEEGNRYVYGLPVYSKNENSISYDLKGVPATNIKQNFIAYKNISSFTSRVGETRNAAYATSYLLTEITTPDFVDRTLNGPDDSDFGGYTKFSYNQAIGSNSSVSKNAPNTSWYHWRIPYTGLSYNAGQLSNTEDDMGSMSSGDKEIYYLKTVETKTHIAVFVTNELNGFQLGDKTISGSLSTRKDAVDAADDVTAAQTQGVSGSSKQQYLERIELYAKPRDGGNTYKLIKTTHLDYDYSLCPNVENNTGTAVGTNAKKGKLTLKKVWFEYEGIVNARISPYKFDYQYPKSTGPSAVTYPSAYQSFLTEYGDKYAEDDQNPRYNPQNIDRWGNYQHNGAARHDSLQPWVDQTPTPITALLTDDPEEFDPAAYQLKRITLPSGGEIHIQYEQHDYLYVEDRRAMAMVSLSSISESNPVINPNPTYVLNVENDLGISTLAEKQKLVQLINQEYSEKKIFFKFFYALLGTQAKKGDCLSDYVDGYVQLDNASINGSDEVEIKLKNTGAKHELPVHVCRDFVQTERGGNMQQGSCDPSVSGLQNTGGAKALIYKLLAKAAVSLTPGSTCMSMEPTMSYFRIPVLHGKKGGGIRVKRILMYDNGIESGDSGLYGSEYIYKNTDGESSGVATNEPSSGREENALIDLLVKRTDKGFFSRVFSGRDREHFEGPLGESLLPPPSIGYSRVVIKNIHNGATNTGFAVNEFFTSRDYPFDKVYNTPGIQGSAVDNTGIDQGKIWTLLPLGLVNISISDLWLSQGYRFIIADMNGKSRSTSTYGGDYSGIGVPNPSFLSSRQEYSYYEPGEKIPLTDGSINNIHYDYIGKETEIVFEQKSVEDITKDGNIEVDLTIGLLPPLFPITPSAMPSISYTESKLRTHVTAKVVHYPAVQKSMISFADGIWHLNENLAFNPHTGKPVITRTTDGYDQLSLQKSVNHQGKYYNYSFPASQQYSEMSQKAANEKAIVSLPNVSLASMTIGSDAKGKYIEFVANSGHTVCNAMKFFTHGDLIRINNSNFYNVDFISGSKLYIMLATNYNSSESSGSVTKIEVIRSGRTNQLNAMAGNITAYGDTSTVHIPISISSSTITARQAVVDQLNDISNNVSSSLDLSGKGILGVYGNCITEINSSAYNVDYTSYPGFVSISFIVSNIAQEDGVSCSNIFPLQTLFTLSPQDGQIYYTTSDNPCNPVRYDCLTFCPDEFPYTTMNVVASSASTFDDDWSYDASLYPSATTLPSGLNEFETGAKGKWRQRSTFVYRDTIRGGSRQGSSERNYNDAGVYPLTLFNWKNTKANAPDKWIKLNTVTRSTPNGEPIEEQDIIGIYSAAKFGYNGTIPYAIAKNATYQSVQFESFENVYTGNKLEEGVVLPYSGQWDATTSHSGRASYKLTGTSGNNTFSLNSFELTNQMLTKGLSMKIWVKDPAAGTLPIKGKLAETANSSNFILTTFNRVAQTGEWSLYETIISSGWSGLTSGMAITPSFINNTTQNIWIDDLRIQPYDASVVSYVYDIKTLRLLASFDDQHFGLFYQYNAEGKLVRKLVETEKGLHTVQETQYHTPLEFR